VAAYVVLEDVWYIIPAKLIRGKKSISLCTDGAEAKYEEYREAWDLLREASELGEEIPGAEEPVVAEPPRFPRNGLERAEAVMNFFRRAMEGNARRETGGDES